MPFTTKGKLQSLLDNLKTPDNNVILVDSATGSDTNSGTENWGNALATLDAAIAKCTANNGDKILIAPGHAETFSTTGTKVTFDIAGVEIIGLGIGNDRPKFTFSHTGANMVMSAASVKLSNVIFITNVDLLTTYLTVSGNDCEINIETRDATDKEVISDFTVTGDRFKADVKKYGYTGGDANARVFSLNGVDNAEIKGIFLTKVTTAIVNMITAACTNIIVEGIFLVDSTTNLSKNVVDTITGSTWAVKGFDIGAGANFSGGSGAALAADDVSAVKTVVDAISDKLGTMSNTGGTAKLADIIGDVKNIPISSQLMDGYKKTTIADGTTIPNNSQAAAGLIATATGGDILIEEIIWQRGATSFVGPTNYEFSTDNTNGLTGADSPNGVALLAKFNANLTGILSLDGATKQLPFVLESTKKLYIHGDDGATSAGGTTDFYIKYKRLAAGASLT
jgi:hypothetical protein